MSKLEVDKIDPQSGTALEIGSSGDTITIPTGATLDASNATTSLPATVVTTTGTQTLTNKSIAATQLTGTITPSDNTVSLAKLSATGTKDATTFLRGDNTFQEVSSGLTLIKSVTASGASSVEFKNGVSDVVIDSTYAYYRIVGFNVTPQTDDRNIQIQFSTDAGSSYITSGYYTMTQRNIDGSLNSGLTVTGSAMDLNNVGNSTNEEGAFEFTVFNPSSSSHFTHYQSMGTTRNSGAAVVFYQSGGIYEATSDIDAFKVFFNTGNISGTFKLYGIT